MSDLSGLALQIMIHSPEMQRVSTHVQDGHRLPVNSGDTWTDF